MIVGKFLFLFLFFVSFALFAGFPITGILSLAFLSTQEGVMVPLFGDTWTPFHLGLAIFILANGFRFIQVPRLDPRLFYPLFFFTSILYGSHLLNFYSWTTLTECFPLTFYLLGGYFLGAYSRGSKDYPKFRNVGIFVLGVSFFQSMYAFFMRKSESLFFLQGGLIDANSFSVFLICMAPFISFEIHRAQSKKQEIRRTLFFYSLIVCILFMCPRSTLFLVVILFLLLVKAGLLNHKQFTWLIPVLAIFFLQWLQSGSGPIASQLHQWVGSTDFQEKISHSLTELTIFTSHPFWGVGFNQLSTFLYATDPTIHFPVSSSESGILVLLAETGILGVMLFTWIICTVYASLQDHDDGNWEKQRFYRTARISTVLLGLSSLIYSIHLQGFFWCWIGIMYGFFPKPEETLTQKNSPLHGLDKTA